MEGEAQLWHRGCIETRQDKSHNLETIETKGLRKTNMTRLDGEKKSPMPWIIGLIVLALLAAAIYYFAVAKGTDAVVANENGVELIDNAPGGLGVDNSADANMADTNMVDANTIDGNTMDGNVADSNVVMTLPGDMTTDGNNAMMDNSATSGNSATMGNAPMNDPAMSNSAMGNSSMEAPSPAVTPASANSNSAVSDDVMATRSKTIKTGDKTVVYKKTVKEDGSLVRDKTIVPEPVKEAKKIQ